MEYIINFCKKKNIKLINLEVSSKNLTAIQLYKSFDFKEVGVRKKYYKDSDALLYTKYITKA